MCLPKYKGKTPGSDRISYKMLKSLDPIGKLRLLELYIIFESSIIPHDWKVATVVSIPKPEKDLLLASSYRPISLITCLSKCLEKIIATRLSWFTKTKQLISPHQVAFKANQSCADALLHIDHYVNSALSAAQHVTILSIDFEKAFDRIGSHVILKTLKNWGVGPKMFNFIKSYLTNRRIRVRVNNTYSNIFQLYNGIPQGSPLSVVLFSIAFNEISKIINCHTNLDHCLYADDLYIMCKYIDNHNTNLALSRVVKDILNWGENSGTKISLNKTSKFHICK